MTGDEKVGALLLALPAEVGASVLTHLGPQREARVRAEMRRLQQQPRRQETVEQLLHELSELLSQAAAPTSTAVSPSVRTPEKPTEEGRPAPALEQQQKIEKTTVTHAASPADAAPTRPEPSKLDIEHDPIAALSRLPIERLVLALKSEQARTVALILYHLGPQLSAELLKHLPREIRLEVTLLLSKEPAAGTEIVRKLARSFLKRDREPEAQRKEERPEDRYKNIATMLRGLEEAERAELLKQMAELDPDVAAAVRENLYEFSDILKMEGRSLQKLLGQVDMKILSVALKDAPQGIVDQVYKNLSKRAGETLKEEIAFLNAVPAAQVLQARKSIVEAIQLLAQAGELFFVAA